MKQYIHYMMKGHNFLYKVNTLLYHIVYLEKYVAIGRMFCYVKKWRI